MKIFFSSFAALCVLTLTLTVHAEVVSVDPADLVTPIHAKNDLKRVLKVVKDVKGTINKAARAFGIDPIHIAGAIAGEHAINVSLRDTAQDMVARTLTNAAIWAKTNSATPDKNLSLLVGDPRYVQCYQIAQDYEMWMCIVDQWNRANSISVFSGQREFFKRFTSHFFNPNANADIGLTFGIGQMSPVRALMVDDLVARAGREPINFLKTGEISRIYEKILDPNSVIYYVAATVAYSMSTYKAGGYDISQNPGLTATLYNIGNEKILLRRTKKEGRLPETNDLGKWVNQNTDAIRSAIQ